MMQALISYVRVTGIRNGRFVEFEFALGDADLSVELIMPFAAFDEFCRQRQAVVLPAAKGAAEGIDAAPASVPGLYRHPASAPTPH